MGLFLYQVWFKYGLSSYFQSRQNSETKKQTQSMSARAENSGVSVTTAGVCFEDKIRLNLTRFSLGTLGFLADLISYQIS